MAHLLKYHAATFRAAALAAVLAAGGSARAVEDPPAKKAEEKKAEFDPKDVRVGPPPELAALREAVEAAARKGENVDEVRTQLDALEKALAGKAWVKPKPVEDPPERPAPRATFPGRVQPVFPGGFGAAPPDRDAVARAQELMLKAAELAAEDPVKNRDRIAELQREATALIRRGGFGIPLGGIELNLNPPAGNGRLGLRVEAVPEAVAKEFDVPAGRGVRVADVIRGMPGEKAGFRAGDVVVEFAGRPVTDDPTAFVRTVLAATAAKADFVVLRKGKTETIKDVELAPAAGGPVNGRGVAPPDGDKKSSVEVRVQNGMFTITAVENGVKFVMVGPAEGGKAVPTRIDVTDGDKKVEAESVAKLPAAYRDQAKKILATVKVEK